MELIKLKTAVFAPMPSASVSIGVCTDAEREREHYRHGERQSPAADPHRMCHIAAQFVEPPGTLGYHHLSLPRTPGMNPHLGFDSTRADGAPQ